MFGRNREPALTTDGRELSAMVAAIETEAERDGTEAVIVGIVMAVVGLDHVRPAVQAKMYGIIGKFFRNGVLEKFGVADGATDQSFKDLEAGCSDSMKELLSAAVKKAIATRG